MKRMTVALVFLTILVALAAPALAGSSVVPNRQAPGWQELILAAKPSKRSSHAMAYDIDRGVAVLFGGYNNAGTVLGDTWEFSSNSLEWIQRTPLNSPSPRYGPVMVYDEARKVTTLFGGFDIDTNQWYSDTWTWDGENWTEVFPADSPSPRWQAAVAYDVDRQVIVLFGGLEPTIGSHDDTWEWDGADWVEQPISGPDARDGAAMAYDRRRKTMVLFGGSYAFGYFGDTWERMGAGLWQESTPPQSPSPRDRAVAVYLPQARRVFMFGGLFLEFYDDTVVWNGQTWATREFAPSPPGRCCFAMVYDPVRQGVFLFGGSVNTIQQNDSWYFR